MFHLFVGSSCPCRTSPFLVGGAASSPARICTQHRTRSTPVVSSQFCDLTVPSVSFLRFSSTSQDLNLRPLYDQHLFFLRLANISCLVYSASETRLTTVAPRVTIINNQYLLRDPDSFSINLALYSSDIELTTERSRCSFSDNDSPVAPAVRFRGPAEYSTSHCESFQRDMVTSFSYANISSGHGSPPSPVEHSPRDTVLLIESGNEILKPVEVILPTSGPRLALSSPF